MLGGCGATHVHSRRRGRKPPTCTRASNAATPPFRTPSVSGNDERGGGLTTHGEGTVPQSHPPTSVCRSIVVIAVPSSRTADVLERCGDGAEALYCFACVSEAPLCSAAAVLDGPTPPPLGDDVRLERCKADVQGVLLLGRVGAQRGAACCPGSSPFVL